jgi:hypothetical protein
MAELAGVEVADHGRPEGAGRAEPPVVHAGESALGRHARTCDAERLRGGPAGRGVPQRWRHRRAVRPAWPRSRASTRGTTRRPMGARCRVCAGHRRARSHLVRAPRHRRASATGRSGCGAPELPRRSSRTRGRHHLLAVGTAACEPGRPDRSGSGKAAALVALVVRDHAGLARRQHHRQRAAVDAWQGAVRRPAGACVRPGLAPLADRGRTAGVRAGCSDRDHWPRRDSRSKARDSRGGVPGRERRPGDASLAARCAARRSCRRRLRPLCRTGVAAATPARHSRPAGNRYASVARSAARFGHVRGLPRAGSRVRVRAARACGPPRPCPGPVSAGSR